MCAGFGFCFFRVYRGTGGTDEFTDERCDVGDGIICDHGIPCTTSGGSESDTVWHVHGALGHAEVLL